MELHKIFKQTKHPVGVSDYYHTYNLPNVLGDLNWIRLFDQIREVKGDIIECGVGRGRSLITLLSLNLYFKLAGGLDRCVYALDSFEGFPEPTKEDKSHRNPKKGDWSISPNKEFKYSVDNLIKILQCAGLDVPFCRGNDESYLRNFNNLKIIKGFFEQTTKNLNVTKIALLHLDGDLYNSVKTPLVNLAPKISIGGIVVIDDFQIQDLDIDNEAFPGARTAVNEFMANNNNFEIYESVRGTPVLIKIS